MKLPKKILHPTVTIGIPAYNEEGNIGKLLTMLLRQRENTFSLVQIIVVNDGSTDRTSTSVCRLNSSLIVLIHHISRKGKSACLDEIIKKATTDLLVLMDADVSIIDEEFLSTVVDQVVALRADVASTSVEALQPHGFIQRILYESTRFKKELYERYRNGDNIYTCHGRAIVLSKRVYKSLKFTNVIVDDAYTYLWCHVHRFRYLYIPSATIFYALPRSLADHRKQSMRFFSSARHLSSQFGENVARSAYRLPLRLIILVASKFILINPLIIVYFTIAISLKVESLFRKNLSVLWPIAHSSKLIEEHA